LRYAMKCGPTFAIQCRPTIADEPWKIKPQVRLRGTRRTRIHPCWRIAIAGARSHCTHCHERIKIVQLEEKGDSRDGKSDV
jgi:hypothetical protein